MGFSLNDFKEFLLTAHQNTYANSAAKRIKSSRMGSKDYNFEQGDFAYHDTYFGESDFIGEEVVYFQDIPVWGMNYYGFSDKPIDKILRPFLMQEPWKELPVRGPEHSVIKEHEYVIEKKEGSLERFVAEERMELDGKVTYRCFLHGGLLQTI